MTLMEAVEKIGKDITASQMFGCKNESQGRMIALSCLTTGRDMLSVPESYHLMNGKLTLQAHEMLGRLVKAGGSYEVLEHSPDGCAIAIDYKGRKFEERLTWQEAQEEPFVYKGSDKEVMPLLADPAKRSQLVLSHNYATPRRRMQHLWARVVSDAVRVVAPNLVSGTYTPEEVADFSGLVTPETKTVEAVSVQQVVADTHRAVKHHFENGAVGRAVVDYPQTRLQQEADKDQAEFHDKFATQEQVREILALVDRLEISEEKQVASLAKRGVKLFDELTREQADEILVGLRERAAKLSESQQVESGAKGIRTDGPITQELEQRIKDKIKEIAQESKDGPALADKIRGKIKSSGIKLAQMRFSDAELLMKELEDKQLEAFFSRSLQPAEQTASESGESAGEAGESASEST